MKKSVLFFVFLQVCFFSLHGMAPGEWCGSCDPRLKVVMSSSQYERARESHERIGGARCCHWLFFPLCIPCIFDHARTLLPIRIHEAEKLSDGQAPAGCCCESSQYARPSSSPVCTDCMCLCYWALGLLKGPGCCCLNGDKTKVYPEGSADGE